MEYEKHVKEQDFPSSENLQTYFRPFSDRKRGFHQRFYFQKLKTVKL